MDPLTHALFWSLSVNICLFLLGSLLSFPSPAGQIQSAAFVQVFDAAYAGDAGPRSWQKSANDSEDLLIMAQQILGDEAALGLFESEARSQGKVGYLPDPTPKFYCVSRAASVGAATAHAMMSKLGGQVTVTVEDLMAVASESAQIIEDSARLESQQEELARPARQLREANQLSVQKDAFLGQISHELRTPMTSIRAFSELIAEGTLPAEKITHYGQIIKFESRRLTRLLYDFLDLSVLENGTLQLNLSLESISKMIERDLPMENIFLRTDPDRFDPDRLVQVFTNIISNACKYCITKEPHLKIRVRQCSAKITTDFADILLVGFTRAAKVFNQLDFPLVQCLLCNVIRRRSSMRCLPFIRFGLRVPIVSPHLCSWGCRASPSRAYLRRKSAR